MGSTKKKKMCRLIEKTPAGGSSSSVVPPERSSRKDGSTVHVNHRGKWWENPLGLKESSPYIYTLHSVVIIYWDLLGKCLVSPPFISHLQKPFGTGPTTTRFLPGERNQPTNHGQIFTTENVIIKSSDVILQASWADFWGLVSLALCPNSSHQMVCLPGF